MKKYKIDFNNKLKPVKFDTEGFKNELKDTLVDEITNDISGYQKFYDKAISMGLTDEDISEMENEVLAASDDLDSKKLVMMLMEKLKGN